MAITDQFHFKRSSAWVGGVLLIVAAVPLLGFALLLGSGGEMIAYESRADHIGLAALVSFPVLIFAIGGALMWGSRTGRYGPALSLAVLLPVDIAAIVGTFWILNRVDPPFVAGPPDHHAVIRGQIMEEPGTPLSPVVLEPRTAETPECAHKTHHCESAPIAVIVATPPPPALGQARHPHEG